MARAARVARVALATAVQRRWPDLDSSSAETAIASGDVLVDGVVVINPRSLVAANAAVTLAAPTDLAGRRKLAWAIERFAPAVATRCALDVGACTGGFTTALLDAGASRVYAVDVGHGQLLGSLRQDPRVVNLEQTNVAELTGAIVSEPIGMVTVDVSYLSLASAVTQLGGGGLTFATDAGLLGLVKPMFELRLATIPDDTETLQRALTSATQGITAAGWTIIDTDECPVRGNRGAIEYFVHAVIAVGVGRPL